MPRNRSAADDAGMPPSAAAGGELPPRGLVAAAIALVALAPAPAHGQVRTMSWPVLEVEARLDAKIDSVKIELGARTDKLAAILDTHRWVLGLHMAMTFAIVVRLFA